MKLTDPNAIKTGEQKLIDLIVENLNWKSVKEAVKSQFKIDVLKDITIDSGDIMIQNNEIAYKINLGPQTGVSVFVDRSGELLEISSSAGLSATRDKLSKPDDEIAEEQSAIEDAAVMASELSAMISKINEAEQGGSPKTQG